MALNAIGYPFDSARAFSYLEKQVEFGARIPGSPEHKACGDWLIAQSHVYADTVIVQEFEAYRPDNGQNLPAYNIIARFNPEQHNRVMLSAHWDTRPISDMDLFNSHKPVPGANDGASGTAILLEIMHHLKTMNPDLGVDIIFWDAEDMGIAGNGKYFCQGSDFYSRNPLIPKANVGILLDMVGDHDLSLPIEMNSLLFAPELARDIWSIASEMGYAHIFKQITGPDVFDDHVPLNKNAGIPTIDIIDFDYKYNGRNLWHTPKDLPSYCAPSSLQVVGDVLCVWLSRQ